MTPQDLPRRAPRGALIWAGRAADLLLLALLGAVAADLLIGLQAAPLSWIEQALYRLITVAYDLVLSDRGLPISAGLAAAAALLALWGHRPGAAPWLRALNRAVAAGAGLFIFLSQLALVAYGALMERALTAAALLALAASLLLTWRWRRQGREAGAPEGGALLRRALVVAAAAAACFTTFALIFNDPMGDPVHDLARLAGALDPERAGAPGQRLSALFHLVSAGLLLLLGWSFIRRPDRGRRAVRAGLFVATGAAALAALTAADVGGPALPLSSGLVLLTLALGADALEAGGVGLLPRLSGGGPARLPGRTLLLCLLSLLCFLHGAAFRFCACPAPDTPGLTRIDAARDELFSALLINDGRDLYLTYRKRGQIMHLDLESGAKRAVDPGRFRSPPPGRPDHLPGEAEGLTLLAEAGKIVVPYTPSEEQRRRLWGKRASSVGDVVLEIDPARDLITGAQDRFGQCWPAGLQWDARAGDLYVGCDDWGPSGLLYRLNIQSGELKEARLDGSPGDVQEMLLLPGAGGGRLLLLSLYRSPLLKELDLGTLKERRQALIGGGNYDIARAPSRGLLAVSRFYASRVLLLDQESLTVRASVGTGFGTRPLAMDDGRGLLLAASVYDGRLWIIRLDRQEVSASLQVGGFVKSLALDRRRGQVYFGSTCGLYRLDLERYLAARGAR